MRLIFLLGGVAVLIVGLINSNAVWVAGLGLIFLSLFAGAFTKNDKEK